MARRYAYLPSSLRGGVANYGDRDALRLWRHRCLHLRHGCMTFFSLYVPDLLILTQSESEHAVFESHGGFARLAMR